jgi:superfamily II DNA/RNA helicase
MIKEIKEIKENKNFNNENNENNENKESYETFKNWDEINISENLLRGIYAFGFETPSLIQQKSILSIKNGRDIIAQSQSGTGKTGAFTIGALSIVDLKLKELQIIIISPTRELTNQIYDVITNLSYMMNGIKIYNLVGGKSIDEDISYLKNNKPHIVVACMGRLNDAINRKIINTNSIKTIIVDEADEIFSVVFNEQFFNIINNLKNKEKIQYVLYSATLPEKLSTNNIMKNPVNIIIKSECLTLEGISQYYIALENDNDKYNVVKDLYGSLSVSQSIIYCNSINRVNILYESLLKDNFPVCRLQSEMLKNERQETYNDFKNGKYRVLISTNITSRGIDIQQVSIVINFDLPKCKYNYLHRIGRSGRFGKKGTAINLITKRDVYTLKEIEKYYNTEIKQFPSNFNGKI